MEKSGMCGAIAGWLVVLALLGSVVGWLWQFRVFVKPLLAALGVGS